MPNPADDPTPLEKEIERVQLKLTNHQPDSDEYAKTLKQLTKLHAMQVENQPKRISKETILIVGANLAGIALIMIFEKSNILTSKAMSFVMKSRL